MADQGRGTTREAALAKRHDLVNRASEWLRSDDSQFDADAVVLVRDLLAEVREAPVRWSGP